MKDSENIKLFLDWLREASRDYNIAFEDEKDADTETQDILHSLELEEYGYHKRAKLAVALMNVRRKRREAKKKIEQLQPVVDWYDENRETVNSLEKLLGTVRKAEKRVEGRTYHQRTDVVARTLGDRGANDD